MAFKTNDLERADCSEAGKHQENSIDNEILDKYVPHVAPSDGPI